MFLEISQVSQESTCVGVSLKTCSITEHLQWLLLWFLQQNNLIFNVITIILGHILNKNCHGNTLIIITLPYIKIPIFDQQYGHLVQKFCSLSRQSPNFITLSSIYRISTFKCFSRGMVYPIVILCIL